MAMRRFEAQQNETGVQAVARRVFGGAMVIAGVAHRTFARRTYRVQVPELVPETLPITLDQGVVRSGLVEIAVGSSLILLLKQRQVLWIGLADKECNPDLRVSGIKSSHPR